MGSFFRMILLLFCFILVVGVTELHAARDECQPTKCNHHTIRFPFQLKGQQQPEKCSYPGFELSCMDKKQTVLELPRNVTFFVKRIDYRARRIQLYDPQGCLARQLSNNLSASLFLEYSSPFSPQMQPQEYTIFNCSGKGQMPDRDEYHTIPCLSIQGFQVLALPSDYGADVQLSWSKPNCTICEEEGRKCKLKKNNSTTEDETECYGRSKKQRDCNRFEEHIKNLTFESFTDRPKQLMATGIILENFEAKVSQSRELDRTHCKEEESEFDLE
ncbi:hypothetical protein SLEP1_g53655 [Rubroshorea leprosula]|uniref:RING-type E3 ubiquitin transferase n=1 Tax=Rubroshorea leprosula TaxID=152421 RepID=A0AAV5MBU6_9ROSI|nr:hypothetical protein SLEP1_g53655 [Rubroshorea leprosula]